MNWFSVEYWRLGAPAASCPHCCPRPRVSAACLWKSSGKQSEFREVIVLLSPTTQSTWITLVLLWEKEGSASSSSYHAMTCPCVPRASCDSPLTYSDLQLLLCPLPLFVFWSHGSSCASPSPLRACQPRAPLHSAPDAWSLFQDLFLSTSPPITHPSIVPAVTTSPQSCHPPSPNFTCLWLLFIMVKTHIIKFAISARCQSWTVELSTLGLLSSSSPEHIHLAKPTPAALTPTSASGHPQLSFYLLCF